MKKIIILYILVFSFLYLRPSISLENKIIYKINNEIITLFDLKLEQKYLIIFNPNLKKLNLKQLETLALDSLLKEKIKEIELSNLYNIEKTLQDENLLKEIKDLYIKSGFKDKKNFNNFLIDQNLDLNKLKKKIAIEMLWNSLIFSKFNQQVVINRTLLEKQVNKEIKKLTNIREYFLSEILIKNEKDLKINQLYNEIITSSKKIGFDNTANLFSKSDSAKYGGKIGWIQETSLSPLIIKNLSELNKGEISKPIKASENFIILKIDDIKVSQRKIDKKKILENRITFEKNQQLERFSIAYLNKVKQNIIINEL
jgi:peptidyl-prolyl cis-trans isomerase SurA